jgi:hypothetical protein
VVGLLVTHLWLLCFPTLPCMDPQMIWVSDMRQWVFDECNNAKVLHHLPLLCWIIGAFLYVDPHKWCDSVMFKNFWIEYYNVQALYTVFLFCPELLVSDSCWKSLSRWKTTFWCRWKDIFADFQSLIGPWILDLCAAFHLDSNSSLLYEF